MRITEDTIYGRCALGKGRRHGRRRPFWWSAPRRTASGLDWGGTLQRLLLAVEQEENLPQYLLYDFGPARAELADVQFVRPRKMGFSRFVRFGRQMLQQPPLSLSVDEAEHVATYCARRDLPSIAHRVGYSVDDRSDIGGWGDSEVADLSKKAAMPNRYSEFKLDRAAAIKSEILVGVSMAVDKAVSSRGTDAVDEEWESLLKLWPKDSTLEARMSAGASVPQRRQQATAARSEKKLPTDGITSNKKKEGVSESSSSDAGELPGADGDSSSAASTSEESTDAEGIGESFAWFRSTSSKKGALHLLDECSDEKRMKCGRRLHGAEPGFGVEEAMRRATLTGALWSPRCWAKLPSRIQKQILDEAPDSCPMLRH